MELNVLFVQTVNCVNQHKYLKGLKLSVGGDTCVISAHEETEVGGPQVPAQLVHSARPYPRKEGWVGTWLSVKALVQMPVPRKKQKTI